MQKKYRTKNGFIRRNIADSEVIIPIGNNVANFNGFIELNSTAALIWDKLTQGSSKNEICEEMCSLFSVPREEALSDLNEFFGLLLENKMIEETE